MLINVSRLGREVFSQVCEFPLELGRQSKNEHVPYYSYKVQNNSGSFTRVVMARATELQLISRQHVSLTQESETTFQLKNLSKTLPILVEGSLEPVLPGGTHILELGSYFDIGDRRVRIEDPNAEDDMYGSLVEATIPPGSPANDLPHFADVTLSNVSKDSEKLIKWLSSVVTALQSAATASDFLNISAKTATQICNLDFARVIMRTGGPWSSPDEGWEDSQKLGMSSRIIRKVTAEQRTIWQIPSSMSAGGLNSAQALGSIEGVSALIASPILNRKNEVIGILYGDRRQSATSKPIEKVEAMLIEIVATGLSGGLARLDEEKAAISERARFEQFFTPELSQALQANPAMLEGRDAEITILFCDVRGFSRISERLGPKDTLLWMNDVMGTLAECVLEEEGVLVDFIGDELVAMWGAPQQIPDHPERACRAALAMLKCLQPVNAQWQPKLGEPTRIGIGINTGQARVGNTGSKQKFKYGPLGHSVNLASRVQTATKSMNTALLITDATQSRLRGEIPTRRLHRVKVRNIQQDVDLYEIPEEVTSQWSVLCQNYETALESYETGEFDQTLQKLGKLLAEHPLDGPTRMLLSRTTESMRDGATKFNPVWELP